MNVAFQNIKREREHAGTPGVSVLMVKTLVPIPYHSLPTQHMALVYSHLTCLSHTHTVPD